MASTSMNARVLAPAPDTRKLLIKWIVALIVPVAVFTFVWKTYDPRTLSLMSGAKPPAERMQPAEVQRIDAKQPGGFRDKSVPR